jgi:hypothetical protein
MPRIYAAVQTQINAGGLKGALLNKAVNTKLANWRANGEVKHTLYDVLVFRKVSPRWRLWYVSANFRSGTCLVETSSTSHPAPLH